MANGLRKRTADFDCPEQFQNVKNLFSIFRFLPGRTPSACMGREFRGRLSHIGPEDSDAGASGKIRQSK